MEVIDLGLSDLDQVSISFKDEYNSSNRNSLGDGIELLMNDKKKNIGWFYEY